MSVKNLSSAQLAEMIGVQRSGISHILSGRNKPSLDFVVKVLETYPDLNESWFLKGEGEMLKSASRSLFEVKEEHVEDNMEVEIPDTAHDRVNDEEPAYYGKEPSIALAETETNEELKQTVDHETDLDTVLSKETESVVRTTSNHRQKEKHKKLVKLIEIYSDGSFKVYHAE